MLDKMTKLKWLTARLPEPYYLPTPSFGVNRALGGVGLASGRIHVYYGPRASGKSTLAMQQVAVAQKEGKVCAYLDSERALSRPWAEKNGVDVDALKYNNTLIVEEALELVMPDIEAGLIDILVVDSVNTLNYKSFFDDPGSQGMGTYARSAKMFTHKLLSVLGSQQQVILISQQSMHKQGQNFFPAPTVGSAIEHWASTMIKFRKSMAKTDVRDDGSFKVFWKIDKSKQSVYPVTGTFYFNPRTTVIDTVDEVISAAKSADIITGSTWLNYRENEADKQQWQGAQKLNDYIKGNPEFLEQLMIELNAIDVIAEPEGKDSE